MLFSKLFGRKSVETSVRDEADQRVESLEDRRMMAVSYDLGININSTSTSIIDDGTAVMKRLGAKTVRVWAGVTDFNNHTLQGGLKRAIDYGHAGFDVLLIVNPTGGKVPNASAVRGWFDWASSNSALKSAVDRWEIGNEVDADKYWKGSLKQYVTNFLAPAADALHDNGEVVVSAGPSWNPEDVKEMIDYGMLNYVDYVGFHPYVNSISLLKTRLERLNEIVGGRKPLAATEWNIRGYEGNKSAWADAVQDAMPIIQANFELNYYFGLVSTTKTKAGPGGIMTTGGSTTQFFNAIQEGLANTPGKPAGRPSIPSTPPTNNGNVPSSVPSVAKISVINADTDQVIIDSLKSGDTINLTEIGTRNIAFIATAGSGVGSVKFALDGVTQTIDNESAYTSFGQSGSNIKGKKIAVGSHTISATPFAKDNATSTAGSVKKFTFNIIQPAKSTEAAKVTGLKLVNSVTGTVIKGYENITANTTIKLSSLPTKKLALVATVNGSTRSVKLVVPGSTRTENTSPFAFFGDVFGKYNTWYAKTGTFTFKATAFSSINATGATGNTLTVKLKFT